MPSSRHLLNIFPALRPPGQRPAGAPSDTGRHPPQPRTAIGPAARSASTPGCADRANRAALRTGAEPNAAKSWLTDEALAISIRALRIEGRPNPPGESLPQRIAHALTKQGCTGSAARLHRSEDESSVNHLRTSSHRQLKGQPGVQGIAQRCGACDHSRSTAATCPEACTPASVRPAKQHRASLPTESAQGLLEFALHRPALAGATVGRGRLTLATRKSGAIVRKDEFVTCHGQRAEAGEIRELMPALCSPSSLASLFLDQLEHDHLGRVAETRPELDHAGVAAVTGGKARTDLVEQALDDLVAAELARLPAGGRRPFLNRCRWRCCARS